MYDENGDPMGDNNCWSIHHYDDDSNEEINEQKYMANGKEYTVSLCNIPVGPGYTSRVYRAMNSLKRKTMLLTSTSGHRRILRIRH